MLFVLFLLELPFVSSKCVQCASPNLQNQWQLTGLARQPANLQFHSFCDNGGPAYPDNMQTASCSTLCFEMVLPIENQYHFVRGCHDDFTEKGVTSQQVRNEKCMYTNVTDQLVAVGDDGTNYAPAVAAVRFAEIGKETDYVNTKLIKSAFEKEISKYMVDTLKCIATQATNCVKSMYYDGTGADNNKESCSGAYCTSVDGYLNGKRYVERGCAPISPFLDLDNVCLAIKTNSSYHSGPGNGGVIWREKRSLDAILDATQCFCTTEYCNTSARTSFTVLLASVVVVSVIRFLY
ncbi:hypothetical protein Aduo_006470 [Ancylostoma duodenale]